MENDNKLVALMYTIAKLKNLSQVSIFLIYRYKSV
jgi:hypothetical protein